MDARFARPAGANAPRNRASMPLLVPHRYHGRPMARLHITDIEAAINHWRARSPSPDGIVLAAPLRALAQAYALMVFSRQDELDEQLLGPQAREAWDAWYDTTPDTPCIAICSTSQGDDWCKGCGRSFAEVQHWLAMTAPEKRATWRRITQEGTALRFTRYAERAAERKAPAADAALNAPVTSAFLATAQGAAADRVPMVPG